MEDFSTEWMSLAAICDLASRKQWVCWRYEKRNDRKTKVPFTPQGTPASTTQPRTWSEMPTCFTEVVAGNFDGLGYVLSNSDRRVCVDLDHCINAQGVISPWAAAIVKKLDSYTERSPGGDGLHIWIKADLPFDGRRHGKIEVYSAKRYMTVTANHLPGTPETINERTEMIQMIVEEFPKERPATPKVDGHIVIDPEASPQPLALASLMVNNKKFYLSWEHTRKDLADQSLSSYDMSLATFAAYANWNDQEIANLLIMHRREYGNPEKALRHDYLERTISLARQATQAKLKDHEAAEVHRVGETRQVATDEGLNELSILLCMRVTRVVQHGLDPASFTIETDKGPIGLGDMETLLKIDRSRAKLISKYRIYLPAMKRREWERVIALVVQVSEFEEVEEGQVSAEASEWLASYRESTAANLAESQEQLAELIRNLQFPIEHDGEYHFRLHDLMRHMRQELGDRKGRGYIATQLAKDGWTNHRLQQRVGPNIYKARVWTRPIAVFDQDENDDENAEKIDPEE